MEQTLTYTQSFFPLGQTLLLFVLTCNARRPSHHPFCSHAYGCMGTSHLINYAWRLHYRLTWGRETQQWGAGGGFTQCSQASPSPQAGPWTGEGVPL